MPPTGPNAAEIEQHVIDPCLASAVTEERFDSLSSSGSAGSAWWTW